MITQNRLKEVLHYNQYTGIFTWRVNRTGGVKAGDEAGGVGYSGYRRIKVDGRAYRSNRLAFLYMTGSIPKISDHIDRNKTNNRWNNLRPCTNAQNRMNAWVQSNNTSGYKGVCWNKAASKWQAQIMINQKTIYLGLFDCKHHAFCEYVLASRKYFREFSPV